MIRTSFRPATKAPNGKIYKRPPRWNPRCIPAVRHLASTGMTEMEIAKHFHINHATFDYWKRTIPSFRRALDEGRNEIDALVEKAFFQSAIGYSHPDVQVFLYKGEPVLVPTVKYYPPNAFAAYKWLTIRQRERWCDITKLEVNQINIQNNSVTMSDFSDNELLALEKLSMKQLATPSSQ